MSLLLLLKYDIAERLKLCFALNNKTKIFHHQIKAKKHSVSIINTVIYLKGFDDAHFKTTSYVNAFIFRFSIRLTNRLCRPMAIFCRALFNGHCD